MRALDERTWLELVVQQLTIRTKQVRTGGSDPWLRKKKAKKTGC